MKRWNGGTKVEPGFYWNTSGWAIATVSEKPAPLPGPSTETYVRIPMIVMLAVGPVMGGLFAMFLPLIGFVMVIRELGRVILRSVHRRRRVEPRELRRAA